MVFLVEGINVLIGKKIRFSIATTHLVGFFVMVLYVNTSPSPQAPMSWIYWAKLDFPISLIYDISCPSYFNLVNQLKPSFFGYFFYLPHLIHGFLGTVWWYFLPGLFMSKRIGGFWKK